MKRTYVAALVLVVGCGSLDAPHDGTRGVATSDVVGVVDGPGSSDSADSTASTGASRVMAAQQRSFQKLQAASRGAWEWLPHEHSGTVMHMAVRASPQPNRARRALVAPERAVVDFIAEYRDLFRVQDAHSELLPVRTTGGPSMLTHVRLKQVARRLPVVGAEVLAHFDADGELTSIDANYVPGASEIDSEPSVPRDEAIRIASESVLRRAAVSAQLPDASATSARLVVAAFDGNRPALAYEITVSVTEPWHPAKWVITIDAKTGEIIDSYDDIKTIQAKGLGVLGNEQTFEVTAVNGSYVMRDSSRGVTIETYTAGNSTKGPKNGASIVTSKDINRWDRTLFGPGAAVDAHAYAASVFDYYKRVHGRNSIDGAGMSMFSTVHFGLLYANAFWDGTGMYYGDGGQSNVRALSAALDVVAHEFTHGVTEAESNLIYRQQSGALNEAVSDIFSVFIEHAAQPDSVRNWTVGERASIDDKPFRSLANPADGVPPQPSHMLKYVKTLQDNGGVHINSGIINHAAYLMTVGGRNPVSGIRVPFGIGWEKSEKLWYLATTKYFMSSTNFAQAAAAMDRAAADLGFTTSERNSVDCAWKAVGILKGTCGPISDPGLSASAGPTTPGSAGAGNGLGPIADAGSSISDSSDGGVVPGPAPDASQATGGEQVPSEREREVTLGSSTSASSAGGCAVAPGLRLRARGWKMRHASLSEGVGGGVFGLSLVAGIARRRRRSRSRVRVPCHRCR